MQNANLYANVSSIIKNNYNTFRSIRDAVLRRRKRIEPIDKKIAIY